MVKNVVTLPRLARRSGSDDSRKSWLLTDIVWVILKWDELYKDYNKITISAWENMFVCFILGGKMGGKEKIEIYRFIVIGFSAEALVVTVGLRLKLLLI